MKRYRISIFGGGERSDVEMDLRPTEAKVIERVAVLFLSQLGEADKGPWMDIEGVTSSTLNN